MIHLSSILTIHLLIFTSSTIIQYLREKIKLLDQNHNIYYVVLECNTLYCFCFGHVVAMWEVRLKSGGTDVAVFRVLGTRRKSPCRTSSLLKSPAMVK